MHNDVSFCRGDNETKTSDSQVLAGTASFLFFVVQRELCITILMGWHMYSVLPFSKIRLKTSLPALPC